MQLRRGIHVWLRVFAFLAAALVTLHGHAAERFASQSTVGKPVHIEQLVLPGGELEAVAWKDETPLVVHIEAVYPHGSAFRYDLAWHGLEPGKFDLRAYLRRKDGSSTADLPALPVEVSSLLPAGQVQPQELTFGPLPWLRGYRWLLYIAGLFWILGLAWILYPRSRGERNQTSEKPRLSLADRLRPLVARAKSGTLSGPELAELERALEGYWRRKLKLHGVTAGEARARMLADPQAGPLLTQVETWLHRPGGGADVDVANLLSPYENLPAEALESLGPSTAEALA